MIRTRRFETPSSGEKVNDTSPADERIGGLLLPIAASLILFLGGVGYWLWVTGHHDKAITIWIISFILCSTLLGRWLLWKRRRYASIHWTLLNHQFP